MSQVTGFVFVIVFLLVRSCPLITLGSLFVFFAPVIKMLQKLAGDEWNTVMVCVIFIQLDTIWWGWNLKHFKIFFCWAYKWLLAGDIYLKISSFPRSPMGFYIPRLDHIYKDHFQPPRYHLWATTRSIGKFAEKLISCQGHFHYTGWLSLQGCYPVPVTLSTI